MIHGNMVKNLPAIRRRAQAEQPAVHKPDNIQILRRLYSPKISKVIREFNRRQTIK